MNKDLRKLIKELRQDGWTHEITGGSHIWLIHPSGKSVFCSFTPSDRRWLKNTRADIRRLTNPNQ